MTNQKVALVTGAGTGIGKASAIALLKSGYQVIFVGRRQDVLETAIAQAGSLANQAQAIALDISQAEQVKDLFENVKKTYGRLDILFNNAGRGTPVMEFDEIPLDLWLATVGTNLSGTFLCSQGAFALMKQQNPQGGRIINNGSISAHAPRPFSAPYTSIVCSQIDIGNAATEMTERMAAGIIQADGSIKVEDRMDVNHVANAVVHMANLPLEANILFMTIMASKMPMVGRG